MYQNIYDQQYGKGKQYHFDIQFFLNDDDGAPSVDMTVTEKTSDGETYVLEVIDVETIEAALEKFDKFLETHEPKG